MTLECLFKSPRDHIALVTGGSRGLGAAFVALFQESGIQVLAPSREDLDLSSPDSVQEFINQNQDLGIDILVNNAGINVVNPIEMIESSDWQEMVQVNLTSPLQLIQGLTKTMKARGWGRIVNISSIFGIVTRNGRGAYSATKSGLNGLTRTAAVELGPNGILVNSICPGYVDTDLTRKNNSQEEILRIQENIPLRRMATPEELARSVVMLCSDMNSYLTGQTIIVDGGFTCQ